MTTIELGENGAPRGLHGALKMHRLHAHQRQGPPPRKQATRARARREVNVFLQGAPQPALFVGIRFDECYEIAVKHILCLGTQHISQAAGHAGTEIQAERPENDGYAAGHVLATVLADTFHYGKRTAVSDSETLTAAAGNEELARSSTVEQGVAGKHVPAPRSSEPGGDGDGSTGQSLPDVVVGFALELEGYSLGKKGTEALARSAMKFLGDLGIDRVAVLAAAHQFAAQARANAAIRVLNRLGLILEGQRSIEMDRIFQRRDVDAGLLLGGNAIRGGDRDNQERIHSRARTEPVVPAGELAERTDAKLRETMAHFLSQRTEVRDHHLRFARESCAQLFVLGGDSHWASVEMALARHDASDGQQRGCAKAEFVRAENRSQHDVAREFQAPVHAERSEEHTSELQSRFDLVCRLLLEKKKKI